MSHTLSLPCGCVVIVHDDGDTGVVHRRVIERRSPRCGIRTHKVGERIFLWEILPARRSQRESAERHRQVVWF